MNTFGFPYTFIQLQQEAQSALGCEPRDTHKALQLLYERGLISYPMTDCAYLPMRLYPEAQKMIRDVMLAHQFRGGLSPEVKSAAWDDEKLTAHHGIVPSAISAAAFVDVNLMDVEMKLYGMIRRAFLDMFTARAATADHFVSASCEGERCSVCEKPATHKVGENIQSDDPMPNRHNLTAYVCCEHFRLLMGSASPCTLRSE